MFKKTIQFMTIIFSLSASALVFAQDEGRGIFKLRRNDRYQIASIEFVVSQQGQPEGGLFYQPFYKPYEHIQGDFLFENLRSKLDDQEVAYCEAKGSLYISDHQNSFGYVTKVVIYNLSDISVCMSAKGKILVVGKALSINELIRITNIIKTQINDQIN